MSVRIMSLVWTVRLPDSEKIVLLALADAANDEGLCWPSMATLSAKCSKSDRTVQAAIKSLVASGHMSRQERPGKGCRYIIHPVRPSGMEGYEPPKQHYLYQVTRVDTGEYYVGARSCLGTIEDDAYLGSGRWVKEQLSAGAPLRKEVIGTLPSREALAHAEAALTAKHFGLPLCRNAKIATPGTLSMGMSPEEVSGETPEATSPRSDFAPKRTTVTPEAASDKPSRTITSPKASPSSSANPRQRKPRPQRLPEDWSPVRFADGTVAREIIDRRGGAWARAAMEKFRNWAANADDRNGRKLDWQRAWANWVIEENNRNGAGSGRGTGPKHGGSNTGMGPAVDAGQRFLQRRGLGGAD